jgi:hypothetical protein
MMLAFQKLFVRQAEETALPAEVLGRRLVQILETRRPRTRYAVVPRWFLDWILPRILPDRVVDRLIGRTTGLLRK